MTTWEVRTAPFGRVFDALEHYTPEQRAEVFFLIESRWCWDCGREQAECEGHASAPEECGCGGLQLSCGCCEVDGCRCGRV